MNDKKKMLYLCPGDLTLPGTGTGVSAMLRLSFFAKRYDTYLVHLGGFGRSPKKVKIKATPQIPPELCGYVKIEYSDSGYFLFSWKLYSAAKRLMEKVKFDFIFADFEKAGLYAYLLSRRYNVPFVYISHNVEYQRYLDFAKRDPKRYPLIPYIYLVERLACSKASLVATVSEEDRRVFEKWVSREELILVPGGFEEKVFHPYYDEPVGTPPIILFLGNFNTPGNKEAVYLVRERIVEKVVSKYPDAIFQFIGANPPTDVSHPNFEFTGFVEDLLPYMRRANVVIVPILIGAGIHIKTIEALACGKYVVSTPKGKEGIHQRLHSLVVCEIDQFAQAICEILRKKKFIYREDYQILKDEYSSNSILGRLDCRMRKALGYSPS